MGNTLYDDSGSMPEPEPLTPEHRGELIRHMHTFQDATFDQHAVWVFEQFRVIVTEEYCKGVYMVSILGGL